MSVKEVVPNSVQDYVVEDAPQAHYWIRGIPAPLIETFWHYATPFIKRALDHASGEFSHEDFRALCRSRDMQLWLVARAERVVGAITTEIVCYPHRKHLRVITLAGVEFDNWMPIADATMDQFARANGCNAVECFTRRGFAKKLDTIGYKMRHCVLLKELDHEPELGSGA